MRQTTGEYRVDLGFNPSGSADVNTIKRLGATLIDAIEEIPSGSDEWGRNIERDRLKALAMTHVENAVMWAVKAATKPGRE